jgi:AbrB family looped-hinge helix DNA binding protein
MDTKLSTKGQVVLPSRVRRRLGLQAGDTLEVMLEGDRIVLARKAQRRRKARIIKDPLTGLPVLTLGTGRTQLTSEEVAEMMAEFP